MSPIRVITDIIIFFMGASAASFLLNFYKSRELGIFTKRSYCSNCKKIIKPYDLIPVISFVFLRGRCRHCKEKIDPMTIFSELFLGFFYIYIFESFSFTNFLFKAIIISICFLIAVVDLFTKYIYTMDICLLLTIEIIYKLTLGENLFFSLKFSIVITLILLPLFFLKLMGFGDIELGFVNAYQLSSFYELYLYFQISFISAGVVALFLILTKKKTRKDEIAFGPYLALAAMFLNGVI